MEKEPKKNDLAQKFEKWLGHDNVYLSSNLKLDKSTVYLNGEEDKRITFSKYMPIGRFCNAVEKGEFVFLSPILWKDPFEMLFFHPQVLISDDRYSVNMCCFAANDITNEEGFWNIWSKDSSEPIVRVTYDFSKLLEEFGKNQKMDFYLGMINYKSRHDILINSKRRTNSFYSHICDYLNDLCQKRDAYKYEIELRLFVVRKMHQNQKAENVINISEIDYCNSIVADVTLPPMEPLGNSHPSMGMYKCMQDCYNLETKQKIEKLIAEGKLRCEVYQSALYCTNIKERSY